MSRFACAAGLLASLFCLSANAQTVHMTATIPFEFYVGSAVMPAGEYSVDQNGPVLVLRAAEGKSATFSSMTLPVSRRATQSQGVLVFNKYGREHFLSKVWAPNARTGMGLHTSKLEKEYIARAGTVQTAGVPARAK